MLKDEALEGLSIILKDNDLGGVIKRTRLVYGEVLRFHIDRLLAVGQATDADKSRQYHIFMSLLYVALAVGAQKLGFFHIIMEAWGLQEVGEGITDDRLDDLGAIHYLVLSAHATMSQQGRSDYTLFDIVEMIPTNLLDWRGGITQDFINHSEVA